MAMESILAWESWADFLHAPTDAGQLASFIRCGTLILDRGDGKCEELAEVLDACGTEYVHLDTADLESFAPYLDTRSFGPPVPIDDESFWADPEGHLSGALYTPTSGYVADPSLAAANLADAAVRAGASLRTRADVVSLNRGPHAWEVTTSDGRTHTARAVINAAGPHSAAINALAGAGGDFTVRTRRIREELHHVAVPSVLNLPASGVHISDPDLGINFRTEPDGSILVGSNGAACDPSVEVENPDNFDTHVSADLWERNVLRLARRIQGLPVPRRPRGVAGLYDVAEDWMPIYDHTDREGFFVAMGTSGNQFKMAPVVGPFMSQLVTAFLDGSPAPQHLTGPLTGRSFPAAAFSRQRAVRTGGGRG